MHTFINAKRFALFVLTALFLFASCSNPTSSDDDHDEHSDPYGIALLLNGTEIAAQEDDIITYHNGDHIELEVGEETDLITVRWIAEDGDRFEADFDEGYSLQWIVENEDVAEVHHHDEDGPWSFHLDGVGEGETTIQFKLNHNDHDHFTSDPFEIQVVGSTETAKLLNLENSIYYASRTIPGSFQ